MTKEIQYSYIYERLVAFKDTDMAGVVHFTQILAYVEEAEHDALLSVGVKPISSDGGFPKVHVDCDYSNPVRFGTIVEVKLGIQKIAKSSLQWSFEIIQGSGEQICIGNFVTAFVNQQGVSEVISEEARSALSDLLIT